MAMIEDIKDTDKKQYAKIARFWSYWLEQHPHRTVRESAMTYIKLYESWVSMYTTLGAKTVTRKLH
jgi:hypothetical protein